MHNYLTDGSMSFVLRFIVLVIALIFKNKGVGKGKHLNLQVTLPTRSRVIITRYSQIRKKEINQFIE